jgi:hypothetical protein
MVERVAMEERWRIRRAWMADSWIVGMRRELDAPGGGLAKRWAVGAREVVREAMRKGKMVERCMIMVKMELRDVVWPVSSRARYCYSFKELADAGVDAMQVL